MKKLHLSGTLSLPIDAATQTFACIGRKGSGKTFCAGKLAELFIESGVQTIILDLVGKWWGLRLAADGKSPGIDIPMFGGLRGDIPLEPSAGALIAETLLESGRSAIIDLSQFSKSARQEFAFKFGERLWRHQKAQMNPEPVHLIIEESQLIVPENIPAGSKHDFMVQMYGMYEEIIRLGRNYGVGVTMITQRPQSVAKEVLNQAEPLLVFQTVGPHERKAIKDWIRHQGMDEEMVDTLPALHCGECWFWSPEWLNKLEKIRIAPKWTFDSTATPKVGEKRAKAKAIKPIDLDDLRQKMTDMIERAKADNPAELRRQIADLKKRTPPPVDKTVLKVEHRAAERAVAKAIRERDREWKALVVSNHQKAADFRSRLGKISTLANGIADLQPVRLLSYDGSNEDVPAIDKGRNLDRVRNQPSPGNADGLNSACPRSPVGEAGVLPIGEAAILRALIQFPDGLRREQLTALTGYKRSTRDTYIQRLRERCLCEAGAGELVIATTEGIDAMPDAEPLPTGVSLQKYWLDRLPEGERVILEVLIGAWPGDVDRGEITESTGYKRSTRDTYLQRMSMKQIIQFPRAAFVKAADILFNA